MNRELYERYKKLDENEIRALKHRLKNSPVALKLTEFLETTNNASFKNTEVVAWLYQNTEANYATLENRFFKLRKKFLDEYLVSKETYQYFTQEESDLAKCISLLQKNEKQKAYLMLQKLEKRCWDNNIFELLPKILDQMIFCNQVFNKLYRNNTLYKKMETAIYLNTELAKFNMISRKLYETNFTKGINACKKDFDLLHDIATKYAEYPRFNLSYQHLSLYYKISSADYFKNMNVISRHYKKYNELHTQHPDMPMMLYRPNYIHHQNFHFKQIGVFVHYNNCEFAEAYLLMKEIYELVNEEKSIYSIYKTESVYINMLNVLLVCERYHEAIALTDNYFKFIKDNTLHEKSACAYTLKLLVHVESFPEFDFKSSEYLLPKLNAYIKIAETEDNALFRLNNALALKARYYFCIKDYNKAYDNLVQQGVKAYYSEHNMFEDYKLLFEICKEGKIKENFRIINELMLKSENSLSLSPHPEKYKQAVWLAKVCKHLLKK